MRADLHTMEQIDLYLQGKLSSDQLHQFENFLATNPELKSMVSDQQLLIQTVNRKALLAEIHAVAGVGGVAWYANPWIGLSGVALVIGVVSAAIYYSSDSEKNENNINAANEILSADSTNTETINFSEDQIYYVDADENQITTSNHPNSHATSVDKSNGITSNVNNETDDHTVNETSANYAGNDRVTSNSGVVKENESTSGVVKNRLASYPNGDLAMKEFISENLRFPGTAKEKKLSGNVKVKFLVTPEGTRTNIESVCFNLRDENDKPLSSTQMVLNQKIANLFEREAARVVRIMPMWISATDSQGNSVLAPDELYFNFSLKEGNTVYRLE